MSANHMINASYVGIFENFEDFGSLRKIFLGGSRVNYQLLKEMRTLLNNLEIINCYGTVFFF